MVSATEVLSVGLASYDLSLFVKEFPRENSKLEIKEMMEQGGGPAANAAYLLSSWGVNTAFAGLLGDDIYGERMLDEFNRIGTDVSLTVQRCGYHTPFSVVLVNTCNGSRTIVNRRSAGTALQLNPLPTGMHPKALLFDGHELEASLSALEAFPSAISILDAGSRRPGTDELAKRVGFLVASERFALQSSGLSDLESTVAQSECLHHLRSTARPDATIVVTRGPSGLIYQEPSGPRKHLAASVVRAIDTTAAGDIFHGAFLYGLLRGLTLEATLKLATCAAGLSVERFGGRLSIPTLASVEETITSVE